MPTTTRRPAPSTSALAVLLALAGALAVAGALSGCAAAGEATSASPAPTIGPDTIVPGDTIEVVATEGGFQGLPARLPAGTYDLAFSNAGGEEHELVLFRNTSGLSLDELAARGDEAPSLVEVAGVTYASAGRRAPHDTAVELAPGVYTVACFVPDAVDGRPHAADDGHATITVVA
jgi:hypothetical protein